MTDKTIAKKMNEPSLDPESEISQKDWLWKKFLFENGVVYITNEAKSLKGEDRKELLEDIKLFRSEKPTEADFIGGEGSLYVLNSGKFLLKEQRRGGKEIVERHTRIKRLIDSIDDSPSNFHLVEYVAVVEPGFKIDEYGRKGRRSTFEDFKTEIDVGPIRIETEISSYVVMPFIDEGISLVDLHNYNEKKTQRTNKFVEKMIEMGIISNADALQDFVTKEFIELEEKFQSITREKFREWFVDFAARNIVVSLKDDRLNFHLVDL